MCVLERGSGLLTENERDNDEVLEKLRKLFGKLARVEPLGSEIVNSRLKKVYGLYFTLDYPLDLITFLWILYKAIKKYPEVMFFYYPDFSIKFVLSCLPRDLRKRVSLVVTAEKL